MNDSKTCPLYSEIDKKYSDFINFDVERRGVTKKAWLEAAIEQMMKRYEQEVGNERHS